MAIGYFTEKVAKPRLKYRLISRWLKSIILQHSKLQGNVAFIFCDDDYLWNLNFEYLKHDYYTDIITFDYVEGSEISGDIYISVERVSDNSEKYGVNLDDEFLRVMVHGILHLLNYNDQSDDEKQFMRKLELEYISLYKTMKHGSSLRI